MKQFPDYRRVRTSIEHGAATPVRSQAYGPRTRPRSPTHSKPRQPSTPFLGQILWRTGYKILPHREHMSYGSISLVCHTLYTCCTWRPSRPTSVKPFAPRASPKGRLGRGLNSTSSQQGSTACATVGVAILACCASHAMAATLSPFAGRARAHGCFDSGQAWALQFSPSLSCNKRVRACFRLHALLCTILDAAATFRLLP